jgi:hypothetical protein
MRPGIAAHGPDGHQCSFPQNSRRGPVLAMPPFTRYAECTCRFRADDRVGITDTRITRLTADNIAAISPILSVGRIGGVECKFVERRQSRPKQLFTQRKSGWRPSCR